MKDDIEKSVKKILSKNLLGYIPYKKEVNLTKFIEKPMKKSKQKKLAEYLRKNWDKYNRMLLSDLWTEKEVSIKEAKDIIKFLNENSN